MVTLCEVVTGVMADSEFVVLVSYFVELVFDVTFGALTIGIGVEVLTDADVKVSAAVISTLDFSMLMP